MPEVEIWPAYKKGGKVKKTGLAKVHKGEFVLTKDQAKKVKKGKSGWKYEGGK